MFSVQQIESRKKLIGLNLRIMCAVNGLGAIHDAIEANPDALISRMDGLLGSYLWLLDLSDELSRVIDDMPLSEKAG